MDLFVASYKVKIYLPPPPPQRINKKINNYLGTHFIMTCIFSFSRHRLHQHLHCRLPSTPLSVVMLDCYCNSKAGMVGMDVMDPRDQPDPRDMMDSRDLLDLLV